MVRIKNLSKIKIKKYMPSKEIIDSSPVSDISGTIDIPGDKSISHRALLLGAMAEGETTANGFLNGEDCIATMEALTCLGVRFELKDTDLKVISRGIKNFIPPRKELDLGNSGTGMRLLMGILSSAPFSSKLTGDSSLLSRPMERIAKPLRMMGARIKTSNGRPPVEITGSSKLKAISYSLPVSSAQLKSAILLASLSSEGLTKVTSPGISRDHTERMLKAMGIKIDCSDTISLLGPQKIKPSKLNIPRDFSSASFFIVAGLIGSERGILIPKVNVNDTRIGLLEILNNMGANLQILNKKKIGSEYIADIFVRKSNLKGVKVDSSLVSLSIDELPILFIAAAYAKGVTEVMGASELRYKESDRLSAMSRGLEEVGVRNEERQDGIIIYGGPIKGGTVNSFGDHRVAMSFIIAGIKAEGNLSVYNTKSIDTSFPNFVDTACRLGLKVGKRVSSI
ncbi:MAG: 3-phosphoshikimate 1-carboxyvinyltransferase [Gammaproteobacteria bacterium TMED78]|nr:MAG: 3-phosphoshikimate 1-carboxyvinyltransferase [Gammaproteobacteria bacterium TMED78]